MVGREGDNLHEANKEQRFTDNDIAKQIELAEMSLKDIAGNPTGSKVWDLRCNDVLAHQIPILTEMLQSNVPPKTKDGIKDLVKQLQDVIPDSYEMRQVGDDQTRRAA